MDVFNTLRDTIRNECTHKKLEADSVDDKIRTGWPRHAYCRPISVPIGKMRGS